MDQLTQHLPLELQQQQLLQQQYQSRTYQSQQQSPHPSQYRNLQPHLDPQQQDVLAIQHQQPHPMQHQNLSQQPQQQYLIQHPQQECIATSIYQQQQLTLTPLQQQPHSSQNPQQTMRQHPQQQITTQPQYLAQQTLQNLDQQQLIHPVFVQSEQQNPNQQQFHQQIQELQQSSPCQSCADANLLDEHLLNGSAEDVFNIVPSYGPDFEVDNQSDVDGMLESIFHDVHKNDPRVHKVRHSCEEYILTLQRRGTELQYGSPEKSAQANKDITEKAKILSRARCLLLLELYRIFGKVRVMCRYIVYEYLPHWQQEQQLASNGSPDNSLNLNTVQRWVERVLDIIWKFKNQIKSLILTLPDSQNVLFDCSYLETLTDDVNQALEVLVLNSFVVEKQPPQVMKTNTRFFASARFLCGNKLNVQMINPTVTAMILSEHNARNVIEQHKSITNLLYERFRNFDNSEIKNSPQPIILSSNNSPVHSIPMTQPILETMIPKMEEPLRQTYNSPSSSQNSPDTVATNVEQPMLFCDSQSQQNTLLRTQFEFDRKPLQITQLQADHIQATQLLPQNTRGCPPQQMIQLSQMNQECQPQQIVQAQTATFNDSPTQQMRLRQAPNQKKLAQQNNVKQLKNNTARDQYGVIELGYNPESPQVMVEYEQSGGIFNNTGILEFSEGNGQMVSQFRNMQLKKIKRAEKKGTESVMDEKFILLFYTDFRLSTDSFTQSDGSVKVKRRDLLFHILAYSLPVVVIVHGNQEADAWATVTWHNAFAKQDKVLYTVPDRVTWRELGGVLSEKFRAVTGRGLSQQNLSYLAAKVYRNSVENDDVIITWNQFSKEFLADRQFTFWTWFHSIFKLTKDCLCQLWRADRIFGFIGKRGCVNLLLGSSQMETNAIGTFLLRFSETELGGITVAWVANSDLSVSTPSLEDQVQISRYSPTNTSANVVMHLEPFYAKDLVTRSLADRVRDLKDLLYLYPAMPKDEAFDAYYSPIKVEANRPSCNPSCNTVYVKTILVTTIAKNYLEANSAAGTEVSNTPNSNGQQSPDGYFQDNISASEAMETSFYYDSLI